MSTQYGNTRADENTLVAEATLDELELNIETLQDLDVDASLVKGGGISLSPSTIVAAPAPGGIRMTATGTSLNPSGG